MPRAAGRAVPAPSASIRQAGREVGHSSEKGRSSMEASRLRPVHSGPSLKRGLEPSPREAGPKRVAPTRADRGGLFPEKVADREERFPFLTPEALSDMTEPRLTPAQEDMVRWMLVKQESDLQKCFSSQAPELKGTGYSTWVRRVEGLARRYFGPRWEEDRSRVRYMIRAVPVTLSRALQALWCSYARMDPMMEQTISWSKFKEWVKATRHQWHQKERDTRSAYGPTGHRVTNDPEGVTKQDRIKEKGRKPWQERLDRKAARQQGGTSNTGIHDPPCDGAGTQDNSERGHGSGRAGGRDQGGREGTGQGIDKSGFGDPMAEGNDAKPFGRNRAISNAQARYLEREHRCFHCYELMRDCKQSRDGPGCPKFRMGTTLAKGAFGGAPAWNGE